MKNQIGIIGFGNMGSAISEQLKSNYPIMVFDKDKNKTKNSPGINLADSATDLVSQVDIVILAVKPQDFDALLQEIKNYVKEKLIISIAAGITTVYIEKYLLRARVIRAMPNMPARIAQGITCLSKGKFATEGDLRLSDELFKYVGKTILLKEEMIDAATAISGSGPGYYFDAIESRPDDYKNNPVKFREEFTAELIEAAKKIGFNDQEAKFLASLTIIASDMLLEKTKLPASELKKQIVSRGGTTEAALEKLHNGGSLADAVRAAVERAKELSKKE